MPKTERTGARVGSLVKGSVSSAGYDVMRERFGLETWHEVLARLPEDERATVQNAATLVQYPVALDGLVFRTLVDVRFGGSRSSAERELRACGAAQADAMLDGFFSVFARFISPKQAYSRAGGIITSVYTGVTHRTEPLESGAGGAIVISGLGENDFVAPWQCGWMERALVRFGATDARVTERSWLAGRDASDELFYDVSWG